MEITKSYCYVTFYYYVIICDSLKTDPSKPIVEYSLRCLAWFWPIYSIGIVWNYFFKGSGRRSNELKIAIRILSQFLLLQAQNVAVRRGEIFTVQGQWTWKQKNWREDSQRMSQKYDSRLWDIIVVTSFVWRHHRFRNAFFSFAIIQLRNCLLLRKSTAQWPSRFGDQLWWSLVWGFLLYVWDSDKLYDLLSRLGVHLSF